MADPIVVKVSELTELTDLATGDLITVVDISEVVSANKTKKLQAGNIKLFTSGQLADSIVTAAKLANDAVETAAIKDLNVTTGKLANLSVTAAKIANGTITATQLADDAVTEAKLGAIKRTVVIPIAGDEDNIIVKNYPRRFAWPAMLDTHIIQSVTVVLSGAVSTSGVVTVAVSNAGGVAATVSVPQGSWSASTSSIATAYKTAASLAPVGINVTAAGVEAKGLSVYLEVLG
jgi:hypothetical protein